MIQTILGVRYMVVNQDIPKPLPWLRYQVQEIFSYTDYGVQPLHPSLSTASVSVPSYINSYSRVLFLTLVFLSMHVIQYPFPQTHQYATLSTLEPQHLHLSPC